MIGLEIHTQLTRLSSKLFCTCKGDYRAIKPNHNVCPICMGLPGTLPRLNGEAVRAAISVALSLNCTINGRLSFFRKNYFYPDLPKNFQITQFDAFGPASIGGGGVVWIDDKSIRISRIQLEEDPGRLSYEGGSGGYNTTLVDYNRAGTALVEIVTEPDFDTPRQARLFMQSLSDVVQTLGVSDPHLEGAIRADGNVSVRGGNRVEIKNINSFHDLEKALTFESSRQESLYQRGITIRQETRHWDEARRITIPSRTKEAEMDYRYFPEADIPAIMIDGDTIDMIRDTIPESPSARAARYVATYGMAPQVASVITSEKHLCDMFEAAHTDATAKTIANMMANDYMGVADTREKRAASHLEPHHMAALAEAIDAGVITRGAAKRILYGLIQKGGDVGVMIRKASDTQPLKDVVLNIMRDNPKAIQEAQQNPEAIHYIVGLVMRQTKGGADPQETLRIIRDML